MDIEESSMENEYVKAKKVVLVDCLTCPLCSNLFREATTIICKECIYQRFEDEGTCCCPICNVYLGISPHEKLRPDNNLHELRMNIFPTNKSPEAPEALATQTTSTRRKKKSLSSLIIDANTGLKELSLDNAEDVPKKAGKSGGVISKSKVSRDVDKEDDDPDWTYSPRRSKKHSRASKRKGKDVQHPHDPLIPSSDGMGPSVNSFHTQIILIGISCKVPELQRISGSERNQTSSKTTVPLNHAEAAYQKADHNLNWGKQDFRTEAADRTNGSNAHSLRFAALETENVNNTTAKTIQEITRRARKSTHESITTGQNKDKAVILDLNVPASIPDSEKQSPATASETRPVSILESKKRSAAITSENKRPDEVYTRVQPIWFSLRASPDQGEDALPQISTSYIRMKDGNVPISTIKKYLLKKLNMTDESEVEIMCGGQTLAPSAPLNSLVDIWIQFVVKTEGLAALQLNPENRNSKDHKFVMVLTYKKSR
ncbi:hypothetical protein AAC387_Pa02g5168 [Persea americana]